MAEHDLEKLLGGFAADTLTPEEKQQLYRTALHNQELFNALADEQAVKELLADPVVRRRLLQALQTTRAEPASGSTSWFEWFYRPAGVAWAGGIAGAVLAVVLGTSLYQESLRQATQSIAKEEAQPPSPVPTPPQLATPPTNESPATSEHKSRSALPPMSEALTGKPSPQAPLSHTTREERRTRRVERDAPAPQADAAPKQTASSTEMLSKAADEPSPSTPQPIASASPPPHPASTPLQNQSEVDSSMSSQKPASSPSARSLFYGARPQREGQSMAGDTRRREKTAGESAQSLGQSEFTPQSLAMAKSKRTSPHQPVGIRYSLTHREQPEHFQDGVTDTAPHAVSLELTVEANQDGYLQLWKHVGASNPQLLFPITETEQPHSKLTAHTPLTISVPATPGTLVIRFSRTNTIPSATFERTLLDDSTQTQLRESMLADDTPNSQSPIHYIVNQDPSLSEIVVHIAPSQP